MKTPHPNPCDTCARCVDPHGCDAWRIRFLRFWKEFNAYPFRAYKVEGKSEKFCYEHPDIVRRYQEKGPCEGCQRAKVCEIPCPAYWRWWDARMEWMKGWWGK